MQKKWVVALLSGVLLVGGAGAALGATDTSGLAQIKSLTQQMFGLQQQIVDKEVGAGLLTQQQGQDAKDFLSQREQLREQALANGQAPVPGMGLGPRFNNGQPLTAAQKQAVTDRIQARLKAIQDGTFVPGSCRSLWGSAGPQGGTGPWGGAGPRGGARPWAGTSAQGSPVPSQNGSAAN